MLKNINKGPTPAQIEQAFRLVHAAGIKIKVYLIVGCPVEREGTINEGSICVKYGNMIAFLQRADFVRGFI